ncbi:MAG TPA: sulfatase [Thermoanaerobaculia bacterium]|jgi:arylsulfatase A-like enzyme
MRLRGIVLFRSLPSAAALAGLLACAACSSESWPAAAPRPNLIVLCVDTLRADHLGAYGYARDTAPFVAELARTGTLFADAHAHSNWTVPATASLLTSLYPSEHGAGIAGEVRLLADDSPVHQIRAGVETLATRLRRAGFRTGLFSGNPYLYGRFQDGFDAADVGRKNAAELTAAALRWLAEKPGEPFFLYLQYMDLHQPVEPPEPFFDLFPVRAGGARGREHGDWSFTGLASPRDLEDPAFLRFRAHRTALYDGALRFVDDEIRRLYGWLAEAGAARNTLVVVTSDHGEEFWDHALDERAGGRDPRGSWGVGHGHSMYEELLRAALVFHGPGIARGRRVDCPVRHVDVMPTVLALLGLPPPSGARGRSLVPLLSGDAGSCAAAPLVAESPAYGPDSKAVISEGHKLIVRSRGGPLLFDLRADPGEHRNLAETDPRLEARLRAILRRELNGAAGAAPSAALEIDEKTRSELRALGYLR